MPNVYWRDWGVVVVQGEAKTEPNRLLVSGQPVAPGGRD